MDTLKQRLIASLKSEGPMNITAFMTTSLFDLTHGFYPTRDPLGAQGDFITSPEISQMFGEMLGLWCVQSWRDMGSPAAFNLIELGPGRGVMMSDMLRAASLDEEFLKAAHVSLIEASAALQAIQGQTLAKAPCRVTWVDTLADIEPRPTLMIGNEFLDCLPIRQFIRTTLGWQERMVALAPEDKSKLIFALNPLPHEHEEIAHFPNGQIGDLAELCPGYTQLTDDLKRRFAVYPGRALFIDYGPASFEFGDTLQAIAKHQKVEPLDDPGNADLTARVDFEHLARMASVPSKDERGLTSYGTATQAEFLTRLGIKHRALTLTKSSPANEAKINRQLTRLMSDDDMGSLFKVLCLQSSSLPSPAGF